MNELEREEETVDVEIYEGDPDFKSSQVLENDCQDEDGDDPEDVQVETDKGTSLGDDLAAGQSIGPVPPLEEDIDA